MSWTAQKINNLFNPHRTLWLGALGLKITREGQFLGTQGGREGGRDEEGRSKGAGREEGGRMQEEGREERGRRDGGRMRKAGVRVLEGRKVGGCRRKEEREEGGRQEGGLRSE